VSENQETHAVESVPGVPDVIHQMPSDVMKVSGQMVVLTWIAFLIAAICLHKLLWKPILKAVGEREKSISDALEGAEQARAEIATSEAQCKGLIRQAEAESFTIAEQAKRNAAVIVSKADDDARLVAGQRLRDAERQIEVEYRKSFEALRLDAAARMTDTLEQMMRVTLTAEQKKAYQAQLVSEVKL
jgi:F-type H+-transporting ATPase subunit b